MLGACSTAPPLPERSRGELEQLWQQHQRTVGGLTGWTLQGRIVVNTDEEGWNGELRWFQSASEYRIQFNAPFGQGAFKMSGGLQGVELRLSDGEVYFAPDAESLLEEHIGWHLPLDDFRYWVTGVPERLHKAGDSGITLNPDGQLAELKQDQWKITYPEYFLVGGVMMPRKVYMKNHALSVRLVIDQWQLESTTGIQKQQYSESIASPL